MFDFKIMKSIPGSKTVRSGRSEKTEHDDYKESGID